MKNNIKQILMLHEFTKFIIASASGRRLMSSGKKVRTGTITQYECVWQLLKEFEERTSETLRIQILHRSSLQLIKKEKIYWNRFFKEFSTFLYNEKKCFDQYVSSVFKIIKTFFHFISVEKSLPIGEFHKKFVIPSAKISPVILSPEQLKFLIKNKEFEDSLSSSLIRIKDILVFGCTVALRYKDLMRLKQINLQYTGEGVYIVLHTQKTGSQVKIPLPEYALAIINKYKRKSKQFVLPQLSCTNLNLGVKTLIKKARWDYYLPKIRNRKGEPVEIKKTDGESYKFYDHITTHTMRRTAITTLLLLGVEENSVRLVSGHAPGSREFYRYIVLVQEYLDIKIKQAHSKLLNSDDIKVQKIA